MLEKQSTKQMGVSGPRDLAKLAAEFVTQVKKTASEQNITDAEQFIKMASTSLIKFSSTRNLAPSVVERLATLFNSAKVSASLSKSDLNKRGSTVALMNPAEVVQMYKQAGLRKSAEPDSSVETSRTFKNHRGQMTLNIVDKDAQGQTFGAEDLGMEIFKSLRQGFLDKTASAQSPRTLVDDIKEAGEAEVLLAKHSYLNSIQDHLRKMCSIVVVSGGPNVVDFLSDVQAARPDLIGAAASFAKMLTKNASTPRRKIKLKSRKVCPEVLRSYGGLTDHLEKVASLQRSAAYLEHVTSLTKTAREAMGDVDPNQTEGRDNETGDNKGAGYQTESGARVGSDRVMGLFGFSPNQSYKQEPTPSPKPSIPKSSPVNVSLTTHFQKMRENKKPPSRDLVDADSAARLKSTFFALLSDEALADEDPYDLEEALNTLHGVAPHLAANPAVARVVVRSMMQYDGVDPLAIKQFAESEREMLRSIEAARGNFNTSGGK